MSQVSLLKTRRFLPMFLTQFFGALNDNILKNALVILITAKSLSLMGLASAQLVAAIGGIFVLPFFIFSAQSGQLADMIDKRTIIRGVKIAEIGIMILAALGFYYESPIVLVACVALMGIHSTVFGPVKYSILPQHLTDDELVGGNALIEAGTFVSVLLGTIIGGVLVLKTDTHPWILPIVILTVAIAGCVTGYFVPSAPATATDVKFQWNPVTPTYEILKKSRKVPAVFHSIWGISWFWFLGAAFLSLFPTYVTDTLGLPATAVTGFLALFSIGIAIGSLLCERLSRWHLELGLVPFGSIGLSLFPLDLFFAGKPVLSADPTWYEFFTNFTAMRICFDLFMFSVFAGFFVVPLFALIQTRSDPAERSRVIAANNIINAFLMVGAAVFLMACFSAHMTVPAIMLAIAFLNAFVAIYIYTLIPEFLFRFCIWGLANIIYRMRVTGAKNVPKSGAAVLISNHVSFVDWMIIAAGVKRPVRFVMHHSFNRGPIMRRLVKRAKIIPIASAKEDPAVLEQAFIKIAAELRNNNLVCIFPEGKITKDGELNPFRHGIEEIIKTSPVPVIPMVITNMWGSFFSREQNDAPIKVPKRFWSRVGLIIDKPIPPEQVTSQALEDKVRAMLTEYN